MPLAVAGFSLTGNGECQAWLQQTLRARVGIGEDVLSSLSAANRPAADCFRAGLDRSEAPRGAASTAGAEQDIAPLLKADEMAELFALTWMRYHLASPFGRLGNSAAYNRLAVHHSLRHAAQTNQHALDRVLEWLTFWLEARGMPVDGKEHTVNVPGYQALYFRSDATMSP
ncbi:hypothetical protein BJG93_32805 (plasmid) [Paraburkholderia sprentiae WSM5005]|uniref:Uncharacterized protein n=1 Tax=Paraburkholderia sprentiae WSM5005 TaxID=754502 RepID=A0ACA8AXD4_9BURK|nr:hypothetical protein [Paraburkholderia sprentiae]APA90377.2 hypothetical protein BJG93_32805 [Paraburkholderia sprentiae WSM5005]